MFSFVVAADLWKYILERTEPPKFSSITIEEKQLALQLLHTLLLLHQSSRERIPPYHGVRTLLGLMATHPDQPQLMIAALDILSVFLARSKPNQAVGEGPWDTNVRRLSATAKE